MSASDVLTEIKQLDLKRQLDTIRPEVDAAIAGILDRTAFIGGQAVTDFERAFADFCQAACCVGVGNGTDALLLAFHALKLKPGDNVVTTPMTFIATAEPLMMMGVHPVFVDIEPDTYNIDPKLAATAITPSTRALLPVHLYGQPATMDPLLALSEQHGIPLIEDAAQAHGATYGGRRIGSLGKIATFSFYPGKNLGAFGDGGAVTTQDEKLATKIRKLADHGRLSKYEHERAGVNSRLDALQAAVLSIKLKRLADWNAQRQAWAAFYQSLLSDVAEIDLPKVGENRTHVYHQYVICLREPERREALMDFLKARGIHTGIHYPIPLHLQPAFSQLGYRQGEFPVAERLAAGCVSLPMYAELSEAEVRRVAEGVRAFFGAASSR